MIAAKFTIVPSYTTSSPSELTKLFFLNFL